jgi:hypothetical protein
MVPHEKRASLRDISLYYHDDDDITTLVIHHLHTYFRVAPHTICVMLRVHLYNATLS